jgi:hypothetical protein
MDDPQQMLAKLLWEIRELTQAMSVWVDNEEFPVAIFVAFNAVVTAWHITDWLWGCSSERRAVLAKNTISRLKKRKPAFGEDLRSFRMRSLRIVERFMFAAK